MSSEATASSPASRSPSIATRAEHASITGSRPPAWCCWRCPVWRCSIPALFFLTGAVRRRPVDPHHPSMDRRRTLLQLPAACSCASGAPTSGSARRHMDRPDQRRARGPRGEAARSRQVQCRPEDRLLVDVDPDRHPDRDRASSSGISISRVTRPSSRSAGPCSIHSIAAVVAICVWIVHVYAAILGTRHDRAMTRGSVTGGWAWRHHRKWLRELVAKSTTKQSGANAPGREGLKCARTTWPVGFVRK